MSKRPKKINLFHREVEVKILLEVLAVYAILALVFSGIYFIEPTITGFITTTKQFSYTDNVNQEFNETAEYAWTLKNFGSLKSIKVSGFIENKGSARIYIENNNIRYLIFDSNKLNEKEILDKITGYVIAEEKGNVPNHPPVWNSSVESFIVNGSSSFNLSDYFHDKDNDLLTYSATEHKTNDLEISIKGEIITIDNKNNIEGERKVSIFASDNETTHNKKVDLIIFKKIINQTLNETPIINITNKTIINETLENITVNKSIKINLEYKVGTNYDIDDNGIETTTGIVDLTVEDTKFNWNVDESKVCTRWETFSIEDAASTFVCYGAGSCCSLMGLSPTRANWDDVFHSYYGLYGATLNNVISAQIIYADYNLSLENLYAEIIYSDIDNLSAIYYTGVISFDEMCIDTCALFDFNETSYKLFTEINDTKLTLTQISYIIEKPVEVNVTLNITPKMIQNNFIVQDLFGNNLIVIDGLGNAKIKGNLIQNADPVADDDDFIIQNLDDGLNLVVSNPEGNLIMKGFLNENQDFLIPTPNSFIVQNVSENVLAYVNSSGSLFLKGILEEQSLI